MSKDLIHTPEGVRDIYGREMTYKLDTEKLINEKFHLYGYRDIQTPTYEYFDVFSKEIGTTSSKELFKFFDKEGATLVLRPDITPSIARCTAKYYMDSNEAVRFCYCGNTFVNTDSLQGKLNEVTQMGAELIGDDSIYADAEMISLTIEGLIASGLKEFQISIGNVEYFRGLCHKAGLDSDTEYELRELISGKNYFGAEDLLDVKNVSDSDKKALLKTGDLFGQYSILDDAFSNANNDRSKLAIERLKNVYNVLKLYGYDKYVSFDLGMLSKYNYYTGIIFKGFSYGVGDAFVKGGRYNNLLGYFGKDAAAVGFVIVIDDLLMALDRQGKVKLDDDVVSVYYNDNNYEAKLKEVFALRTNGTKVELLREK